MYKNLIRQCVNVLLMVFQKQEVFLSMLSLLLIGRRIFRQRLETGDHDGDVEQRRKLIYVSTLVFGDASSFLLPWKRVFKFTDSQMWMWMWRSL
ncbi:protein TIC110, chloroplastic-like [Euphorbia lathyris]|uniref:protein TIC110, chloroplastic-like n=1 Tax=Euphorbia lathyris TaxID=212925 RepID=UPI0033141420